MIDPSKQGRPTLAGKGKMREKRPFLVGAIDLETTELYKHARVVMAQCAHEAWGDDPLGFRSVPQLVDYLLNLDAKLLHATIWFAHNSEFDWRFMLSAFKPYNVKLEMRERVKGKFYEMRVLSNDLKTKAGRPLLITRFRDSMAVYPSTLSEFTAQFAPAYVKQDIGLNIGVRFDPKNPTHKAYALNDVVGLMHAVCNFDTRIFENFKVHITATTSSTAYAAWLRTIPKDLYLPRQSPAIETFLRLGYYGGLVGNSALADHEYQRVDAADINSSYPANMRLGVPKGRGQWTYSFHPELPGWYEVKATVPRDAILPIVPFRDKAGRLAWGRGEAFPSNLSEIEINYVRALGVEIEIVKGVYFPDGLIYPFNDFVDTCERLRAEFKGTPTEIVVKLMQNSLYGRFGMRIDGRECEVCFDGQPDDMEAVYDPETNETVPDVYYRNVTRDTEYMHPHFSARITANARILIDRICEAAGRMFVVYRDTDSVHVIGEIAVERLQQFVGTEYGKLKMEPPKFRVKYHAPKCYTYTTAEGVTQATFKGIPRSLVKLPPKNHPEYFDLMARRNKLISVLHAGEASTIEYWSVTSVQTYLRTGELAVLRKRSATSRENIFGTEVENGVFRPRTITADMK